MKKAAILYGGIMFNKNSMKTKIIIFTIVSVIAIASIVYDNRGNFKASISSNTNTKKEIVAGKGDLVSGIKDEKMDDAKVKAEEAGKAKQKALDDEWKTGYDVYNQKKDNAECIRIMDDIIAKDDKYYEAYTLKGIALCFTSSGHYEEGMKNLDKALELKPDYGYGRFNKALAFELYAKYPEAIAAYKSALEVEDYIWSYYGIASIYGRYGDSKNSVYYLNFAIKQDPEVIKSLVKEEQDFDNVRNSKEFIAAVS